VTGTVFNVPIGVHPIKFKVSQTTNWGTHWLNGYMSSMGQIVNQYPIMNLEGELLKPAKKDKKAPMLIPNEQTSTPRPPQKGRFVSVGFYYNWNVSWIFDPLSKNWRYSYRQRWSQGARGWAWNNRYYRKVLSHDATEGETFASYSYYPNGNVWSTVKGTLSFYDKEGWFGIKHTDKDWMCNQGLNNDAYNNNSWYNYKPCNDNNGYSRNKSWQTYAYLKEAKWLIYSNRYKYFFYYMYTIPKNTTKSAIYVASEYTSTFKITAKGTAITLKNILKQNVNAVYEKQFKKALKSKDTITFEVNSSKSTFITALINYKDKDGKIILLSADKYMDCGKGQIEKRINTLYSRVNSAPLITLLSGKAQFYVGQNKKKMKCTVKLP